MQRAWWVAVLVVGCHGAPDELDDLSASPPDLGVHDLATDDASEPGDGGTFSPEWQSGSRLRAKTYRTAGGAEIFSAWHDSTLGVDCSWQADGTGTIRCAPSDVRGNVFYTDAGCTMPIYQHASCESPPAYITNVVTYCDTMSYYRIGAAITAPATAYILEGTNCVSSGSIAHPDYTLYATSAVQPSAFVEATVSREPRGAGLAADVLTTADGAIDSQAVLDTARDAHCNIDTFAPAAPTYCAPEVAASTANVNLFSDSTCTTHIATYAPFEAPQPFCTEKPTAIRVTGGYDTLGAIDTSPPYSNQSGPCMQLSIVNTTLYAEGPPIPTSTFVPLSSTTTGSERLQVVTVQSSDGVALRRMSFFDQQRMELCNPTTTSDSQLRCVPTSYSTFLYSDASCTMPVLQWFGTGAPPLEFTAAVTESDCGETAAIYSTGAAFPTSNPLYFGGGGGSCTSAGTPDAAATYYSAAALLPPSDFAALTLAVE